MSQWAVSKRIAKLEGDLGVPLLIRSRTGVASLMARRNRNQASSSWCRARVLHLTTSLRKG
ncbi:LysR family transcriptional regulator [Nonomuraea sp. NPDC048882]|uniref:helix-turn-helix domain-containing protein n=1 Tax=Nonomuraea sp. NPDC048882 TaxID=3154347 RepID=UPI0034098770